MIYTQEVQNMCPVAKGAKHEPAPIPEEGKWIHSKKIEDIYTRCGLVCSTAGCLQTFIERKEWYYRRSIGRDYRMFRYDPFRSYGSRDFTGKNNLRSIEY